MSSNIIEIIGLNYKDIFSNFSIAFEKNKFITVSGPNKCGKTALLRIIDNEIPITNSIIIKGKKQEDYKITDLAHIIKKVLPTENSFARQTVEEELLFNILGNAQKDSYLKNIKEIAKLFKLNRLLTAKITDLDKEQKILLQLASALLSSPDILLIDDFYPYFSTSALLEIVKNLKAWCKKEGITIIMITSNLTISLESDYTYILNNSEIVLEGDPKEVLENDNILNKVGLDLPFMMDLSVKLRDYDLIKKIELDMEELVNTLWN